MKKEHQFVYYGILFYFLYSQVYKIISNLLITPILIMQWNIYLIPFIVGVVIFALSFCFYRLNKFSPIKIWIILLIVLLSVSISFIGLPARYYMLGGNSIYSIEKQSIITKFILYGSTINTIILVVLTYIKYIKMRNNGDAILNE
jgi:RsiW-degrading membrane proteinase PrsW (M82 family)